MFVEKDDIEEKFARLRLIRSDGIGPVSFSKLLEEHGSARKAVSHLSTTTNRLPKNFKLASEDQIEEERQRTLDFDAVFIFLGEERYPETLAAIPDAPPVLIIKGKEALLHSTSIGIVGARNASAAGQKITSKIATALGEQGITITSGLARGIDTSAHKASLLTGTIACLAGGIDFIYPPENTDLYNMVAKQGLLVTEMAIGTEPKARHFPRRNRIISGLSTGLLVVEAAKKSGSLITARFAAEQGRDVFAVPGSPLDPRAQGTNQLIKDGAILTQGADDIIPELGQSIPAPSALPKSRPKRPSQIQRPVATVPSGPLVEYLSHSPIHIDEIVRLTGRSSSDLMAEFLVLELSGEIIRHAGGKYSLAAVKN
ncbi:DNA-processing protein DprA [Kordiimonas laminariae]|uniref:DNA-processing protein DprA n=1 Tax=Kordiimonas laminariae TaxID=2917717 RepID=UPI001FF4E35E|nr:DNA-processing protein DprA [Kordiimonas laminariae]MCK0069567.1 DNA-processing protein DprA [Kordiimonas laminariae]